MADDLLNQAGNNRLFSLDHEFRRYRKRLRALLEAAFSTHRETEPVLFRGCYFTGDGARAARAGLRRRPLPRPRGRIFAEHLATHGPRRPWRDDRYYRRIALGVGLGGRRPHAAGLVVHHRVTESPWWWAGLVAVVIAWGVALYRHRATLGGRLATVLIIETSSCPRGGRDDGRAVQNEAIWRRETPLPNHSTYWTHPACVATDVRWNLHA